MRKMLMFISLVFVILIGCQKEIYIDYNDVEEVYVIEGVLADTTCRVIISKTRNMSEAYTLDNVQNAEVTIITPDGQEFPLELDSLGEYVTPNNIDVVAGCLYTLKVVIDGQEFIATSYVQQSPEIESVIYSTYSVMGIQELLLSNLIFLDVEGGDSYYQYKIYINDELYSSGLTKDSELIDGDTIKIFSMLPITESDESDIIVENGSEMLYELQSIDRYVYDYLYSLSMVAFTTANPITNFSGGCLGYFKACTTSKYLHKYNSNTTIY